MGVDRDRSMKSYLRKIGGPTLTAVMVCHLFAQGQRAWPTNEATHFASSRQEVEAYAATNKTFAPAIGYVIATLDGHQPEQLPGGVTPKDVNDAILKVFPNANSLLDQPINFYGKVLDENNRPVSRVNIHFDWTGFLIHGRRTSDGFSDKSGSFSLTNQTGQQLNISVSKSGYYTLRRNWSSAMFQFSFGSAYKPDPHHPVLYYLHKKGIGANSLITSQYGIRNDFWVKLPLDGTAVKVDLLGRKTGDGPLELSQVKPDYAKWKTATNWSFSMKIPDGGFIEESEEFPFHPPASGYRPVVAFDFEKGQTNWAADFSKDYYIRFGVPPLYGHLHVETGISTGGARLTYTINPDGSRNLEPENENSRPAPPPASLKSNLNHTNASEVPHLAALPSASSNQTSALIYTCITIGGRHGVQGAADGINGASLFNQPWGIAADRKGSVYVAEWGNSTLRKFTLIHTNWAVSTIVGTAGKEGNIDGTNTNARLNHPHGIAVDNRGDLYVADTFNNTVRKIRHVGTNWVVTTIAGRVGVFGNADGTNSEAEFSNPGGITMDRQGNLYVTDVENNAIRRISPAGSNWVVTTIAGRTGHIRDGPVFRDAWGSVDGTNTDARFSGPFGVAADSHGNLFVADYGNSTIRKVTPIGTNWVVTTIAGLAEVSGYVDGTNNATRFDHPRAIAIDNADNIYVDDTGTDTIRLIKRFGTNYVVKTIVGLPWRWGYADGTNNTPQFNSASGIAVDKNGDIYLADTGNDTVRQIAPPLGPKPSMILIIIGVVSIVSLLAGFFVLLWIFRQKSYQL
jgi:hypothetical protein